MANQNGKRPVGRPPVPTKLTRELTENLSFFLERGVYIDQAAHLCGLAPSTASRTTSGNGRPVTSITSCCITVVPVPA